MNYKAEFRLRGGSASFYIEMRGSYDECWNLAELLAPKWGAVFTGVLEPVDASVSNE